MREYSDVAAFIVAAAAAAVAFLFGRLDAALIMLFTFSAVDYFLGSAAACQGEGIAGWSWNQAVIGATKKLAMLLVVVVVNQAGQYLQDNGALRNLAVLGYAFIEGTSVLRNARLLGVQVPAGLDGALDRLKPPDAPPPATSGGT